MTGTTIGHAWSSSRAMSNKNPTQQARASQSAHPPKNTRTRAPRRAREVMTSSQAFTQSPTRVMSDMDRMIHDYAATLTNPKEYMSRIPDSDTRRTALARSTYDFPILANFSGNPDDGRFAVVAKPTLGKDTTDPNNFKIALAKVPFDTTTSFQTQWTDPTVYSQVVSGFNIRQDRYIQQLVGVPTFFFGVRDGGATTGAAPFGAAPVLDQFNYGNALQFDVDAGGVNPKLVGGPGVYVISIFFENAVISPNLSVISGQTTLYTTNEYNNTAAPAAAVFILDAGGDWSLTIQGGGGVDPISSWMTVTSGSANGVPPWENAGAVTSIRPVAMSMLFTSTQSALLNGGMVAGGYLPSGTCASNWFSTATSNGVGQLQDWENLEVVGDGFKLAEGCYVWWSPEDIGNNIFVSPEESNSKSYPCLAISGQANVNPGTTGTLQIGRLEVVTIYEYTTNIMLYEQIRYIGSQAVLDATFRLLADQVHIMPNETHKEWILRVLKRIGSAALNTGKFLYDNRAVIGPLVARAGALAL